MRWERKTTKNSFTVRVQYQVPERISVLVNGIHQEVLEKDKALAKDAARFGGELGKSNFRRETNEREIEFTFTGRDKASWFRDIVNMMPGMKVRLIVVKPGGGSKSGGSWH